MQDCLEILEREKDHELDDVLVSFVKVQRVGDEAYKLLERDVIEDASQAPAYVFKKSLLNRLDDVRRNLSPGLASHGMQTAVDILEANRTDHGISGTPSTPSLYRDPNTSAIDIKSGCPQHAKDREHVRVSGRHEVMVRHILLDTGNGDDGTPFQFLR